VLTTSIIRAITLVNFYPTTRRYNPEDSHLKKPNLLDIVVLLVSILHADKYEGHFDVNEGLKLGLCLLKSRVNRTEVLVSSGIRLGCSNNSKNGRPLLYCRNEVPFSLRQAGKNVLS
jgi:hypothetical protein